MGRGGSASKPRMALHWASLADLSVHFPPFAATLPVRGGIQIHSLLTKREVGARLAARTSGRSVPVTSS